MDDSKNETEIFINGWHAYVRSDVYQGSANEDGEHPDELSFYVVLENEQGIRYASKKDFTTTRHGHNSNGVASALAERFCVSVKESLQVGASPVSSPKWSRVAPNYNARSWGQSELETEARELEVEAGPQEAVRFRFEVGL